MAVRAEGQAAKAEAAPRRRRAPARRRRRKQVTWHAWARHGLEATGLVTAALVAIIAILGHVAERLTGTGLWSHLVPFAAVVLAVGIAAALGLRLWLALRSRLIAHGLEPVVTALALGIGITAVILARRPAFDDELGGVRRWVGGAVEAQRLDVAHQVYASYRRADLVALERMLERARVYEPTVVEAADAFGVDREVLMGIGSAESSFYPRDSADGGRGLFQITAPPAAAVAAVKKRLEVAQLDPLNQRHNAYLAAATLHLYLSAMQGDPFLGLLAYNIGPKNGGLASIMQQYGARDFTTIQPYLQSLPRDYPVRVLAAALAYRLWRSEGRLPRYEDGDNARRIQQIGIPGLSPAQP